MFRFSNRAGIAVGKRGLEPAAKGISRAIRITVSVLTSTPDQWYPFAYEVEPSIPIVLPAKKYSQSQCQAQAVSRHGNEQAQLGTSRNSERQNHHCGRFSPSQPSPTLRLLDKYRPACKMVATGGRVATQARRDLPFFLAQTRLASSGQVHHVRERKDARLHMEVGPRIHRHDKGHTTLPINTKRGNKTHPSARGVLEKLGGEKDQGRTRRRLDFLSEEAPRTRPGTINGGSSRLLQSLPTTVILRHRPRSKMVGKRRF